jgi:hypothetical protein
MVADADHAAGAGRLRTIFYLPAWTAEKQGFFKEKAST